MDTRHRLFCDLALLVSLALAVRMLTALPLRRPGYMDAAYYVDSALSLYEGNGFLLPLIWNYLEYPAGIPHPSHLYWMPLSSILAYLAFQLFGSTFRAAQAPFGLLSALLPALSYLVAYDVAGRRRHALCAGLFALFSGFYMAYWVVPDAFAPFALAGALCLWALGRGLERGQMAWFAIAGFCAGLGHLARADGLLLVVVAVLVGIGDLFRHLCQKGRDARASRWVGYLAFTICYLLVMSPWFARNLHVIGRPLSTAGVQTVWLTDYDDLYSYGKPLTMRAYLAWGWRNILLSKVKALWLNAQTLLVAGWMIFLAPVGMIGAWRLRRHPLLRPALLYGGLLYLIMSLVFTLPGWRGGMLHSTVALLPAMYAMAMEGLDACIAWVASRRQTWQVDRAQRVLSGGLVAFAVLLSAWLYGQGLDRFRGEHLYAQVAMWMRVRLDVEAPGADYGLPRVMVNDPASFYYYSGFSALSIPNAGVDTVLAVMGRYGAEYLVLDGNYVPLRGLYTDPSSDDRLVLLATFGEGPQTVYLYRVEREADP
jgi:4-amino-4-deoxy-L-arabinose transferase-like glycosyltransferase